jgi:hypothetical protein
MSTGPVVDIQLDSVTDTLSFHKVFAEAIGFPEWYGRNFDAWIDCMSRLASLEPLSSVTLSDGEVLTLRLRGVTAFKARCPDLYDQLVECSGLVNRRGVDSGRGAMLALAYTEEHK